MGSGNQARPLGRAAFYLCFDVLFFLFLFFFHADRASCINIYLYILLLYICKAFDTVDHNFLLSKVEHYGIRGAPLMWL